ncbi:MAG: response regulator transcription factor, partial [Oscillospiraceae bacterium]|jgi:DNA-binding response OmpR family regulator|nr:response regulator transcription factor [Oscillospiraceae bacterium]
LQAWEIFQSESDQIDLCLLDVMMPGLDGLTLCKKIREAGHTAGIIFLSAMSQEMNKVQGLLIGADDYMTKPFSPSELMARVEAVLRRTTKSTQQSEQSILVSGPFCLDTRSRSLRRNKTNVELTSIEMQLMLCFLSNKNKILTREEILKYVWGSEGVKDTKIVDVNIRRLRVKVEDDPSNPKRILSIWGYGYKWIEA